MFALPFAGSVAALADGPTPVAVGVRVFQNDSDAELVFDLSGPVKARVYGLEQPDRIVVDLPRVNFQLDPAIGRSVADGDKTLIKAYRFGLLDTGRSRIVIDLTRPACPSGLDSTPIAEGAPASRLRIALKPCDSGAFAALEPTNMASALDASLLPPASPPVIVLDPGHGGIDAGAHGLGGIAEKSIVWDFCQELRRQLEAEGKYRVVTTRNADDYVSLEDRVDIARQADAALFISVHADTLSEGASVSGSTVYTASERASDAEAARIAARENAADGGVKAAKPGRDPDVTDILFDLRRRETRAYAHLFSHGLVGRLGGVARLNHNPERSASFVVLKAPEFPSVLVELGYLSNPQDVKALVSPEWRVKAAAAMTKAIDAFFAAPPPGGASQGVALGAQPDNAPNR